MVGNTSHLRLAAWQVMVKGEGLRVVKHNRSGGSQMRIIRYDPEIKALVWNSKRYMKKGERWRRV